jgi:hypothetical protein
MMMTWNLYDYNRPNVFTKHSTQHNVQVVDHLCKILGIRFLTACDLGSVYQTFGRPSDNVQTEGRMPFIGTYGPFVGREDLIEL